MIKKTIDIGFSYWEDNELVDSETQFDIEATNVISFAWDALDLWTEFIHENNFNAPMIRYVEEDPETSWVELIKSIYLNDADNVMSEWLGRYRYHLTVDEMRDLLAWCGDDEYVYVTDNKEIVNKGE